MRVPAIFRWPDRIPAGQTIMEVGATIDILPTVAGIASGPLREDLVIDGKSILPLLEGRSGARSPHDYFLYFNGSSPGKPPNLAAIRDDRWKLHLSQGPGGFVAQSLYDLWEDPSEGYDRLKLFTGRAQVLPAAATERFHRLTREIRPVGRHAGG